MAYSSTHQFFRVEKTSHWIWGSEEASMCKRVLGDTEPCMLLEKRKWFTGPEGIWIRRDCLDNELVTWFALKSK